MKTIEIKLSNYEPVNFLWSDLIESFGFDKAKKIVTQAIDLQKMNGKEDVTMPIVFTGTGGLALIPIDLVKRQTLKNCLKETQVLIFNPKKRSFQILYEAN